MWSVLFAEDFICVLILLRACWRRWPSVRRPRLFIYLFFTLFSDALICWGCIASNVNGELQRLWREVVITYCKLCYWYLLWGAMDNHERLLWGAKDNHGRLLWGAKDNHGRSRSTYPVSRFEPRTSRKWSRSDNLSIATSDTVLMNCEFWTFRKWCDTGEGG